MEISRIASAQRRTDLAFVMGEVSSYVALTSREVFLRYQFRRSLAKELDVKYAMPPPPTTGWLLLLRVLPVDWLEQLVVSERICSDLANQTKALAQPESTARVLER